MGTLIPTPSKIAPVLPGDDETFCWGVGEAFGIEGTPLEIVIRISGVTKGPGWIPADGETQNGEYLLTQHPVVAGIWLDDLFAPTIFFRYRIASTEIDAVSTLGEKFFYNLSAPKCQTFVENQLNDHFEDGSARIWISEVQE